MTDNREKIDLQNRNPLLRKKTIRERDTRRNDKEAKNRNERKVIKKKHV